MQNLCKPACTTWKLFLQLLKLDLNWMFLGQDVINSKPGFVLAERKWLNLITVCDFTEKRLHIKYGNYSLWFIMKNQKQQFTSVSKIAVEFFFKIQRKMREQESNLNRPSYLKPAILSKKKTPTTMLSSAIFETFQDSCF